MAVVTIARFTLLEASRRRVLITVGLLTLVMIAFTAWGFSRLLTLQCGGSPCNPTEIRLATAILVILVAYAFNVILAMGSVFIAAPTIAGEIESGLSLAILPRPIRRAEVVLGKWLALGLLVALYTVLTTGLEFIAVKLVLDYLPPHPFAAIFYLTGEAVVLLTLAVLISTRLAPMAGGVIAVIVFGMAWLAGVAEAIGLAFDNTVLTNVGVAMSLLLPTDGLWRGAVYSLEPIAVIGVGSASRAASINPFFAAAPPPAPFLVWAAAWVVVVLSLAVFSFNRRDL
ncbi:MAG TPA: ABC transporter permease [Chloroflexota bacterium]|jgi:ABC-type transport system involved in multi-copper enzyme maturation permease subunit